MPKREEPEALQRVFFNLGLAKSECEGIASGVPGVEELTEYQDMAANAHKALSAVVEDLTANGLLLVPEGEVGLSLTPAEVDLAKVGGELAEDSEGGSRIGTSLLDKLRTALEAPEHPGGEE